MLVGAAGREGGRAWTGSRALQADGEASTCSASPARPACSSPRGARPPPKLPCKPVRAGRRGAASSTPCQPPGHPLNVHPWARARMPVSVLSGNPGTGGPRDVMTAGDDIAEGIASIFQENAFDCVCFPLRILSGSHSGSCSLSRSGGFAHSSLRQPGCHGAHSGQAPLCLLPPAVGSHQTRHFRP